MWQRIRLVAFAPPDDDTPPLDLWVEVGPPRLLDARDPTTGRRYAAVLRYFTNVVNALDPTRQVSVPAAAVELLAEFAKDVPRLDAESVRARLKTYVRIVPPAAEAAPG